jgi:hypothetical protein
MYSLQYQIINASIIKEMVYLYTNQRSSDYYPFGE